MPTVLRHYEIEVQSCNAHDEVSHECNYVFASTSASTSLHMHRLHVCVCVQENY